MQRPVSRLNKAIFVVASLFVVAGQLSAYPLVCAMPGMDMDSMNSQLDSEEIPSVKTSEMMHERASAAGRQDPSSMNGSNDCEQVCGYCLSYNQPGATIPNLISEMRFAREFGAYSQFTPPEYHNNPFRPPISV